ncbi:hypothetical protein [Frigidibacter sp. MR17.24]|uniref:hypothetical protein n=1 Tax=Frigidibacter sp. MR17.24 TaxID=3127345 RepID=UPI00301312AA
MLSIAGLVIGAIWGGLRARARGGSGFDIAQYAAVHGLGLAILGLFVSIVILRAG